LWSQKDTNNAIINDDILHGTIVQQASTNEVLFFDDIDNIWWDQTGKNVVSRTGIKIANRNSLGLIGKLGATITPRISRAGLVLTQNTHQIITCFVKKGTSSHLYFSFFDLASFETHSQYFNITDGSIANNTSPSTNIEIVDKLIEKVNNGYKCTVIIKKLSANNNGAITIGFSDQDNLNLAEGDNIAVNGWINSIQFELNKTNTIFPNMPMLNIEGAVSTQEDELIEYNKDNYSEIGSICGQFYLPYKSSILNNPASIYTFQEFGIDTENSTRVHLSQTGTLQFVIWPNAGAAFGLIIESPVLTKGSIVKFAAAWEKDNVNFFVNGIESIAVLGSKSSIDTPLKSNVNKFYLGSRNSTGFPAGSLPNNQDQFFNLPINYIKKYNTRVSDKKLKLISI